MTRLGTVALCARYPVKSVLGEQPKQLWLAESGPMGDRVWALRTADGRLGSGKSSRRLSRLDRMLEMSAGPGRLTGIFGQPVYPERAGQLPHHDASPLHLVTTSSLRWWAEQASDEQPHAATLLRALARHELCPGVYASVMADGLVRVGDPVVTL